MARSASTPPPGGDAPPPTSQGRPRRPPAARPRRRAGRWIALALVVAALGLATFQIIRVVRRPPEVTVVLARVEDVSRMLAVTGRIEAVQTVSVRAQFAGRITEVVRREGERVSKDDVLARLADPAARADVLQQQAELTAKKFDLKQAQRDLARTAELQASGAAATADLETARLAVARATEDVRRLTAAVGAERAQLTLLAPFDGVIVRRDGEVGQVVGPESDAFEIASIDAVRVTAEVDERYVRALRRGMRAEILPLGGNGARRTATVDYVAQAVDKQTGAATVRFAYDEPPTDAVIGLSVDVNISVATVAQAVTIPREAVAGGGARPFVLVEREGRVERREIAVVDWPAAKVVVQQGLSDGERVLLDPKSAKVGAEVRAKQLAEADEADKADDAQRGPRASDDKADSSARPAKAGKPAEPPAGRQE